MTTTIVATNALTDLVLTARAMHETAEKHKLTRVARSLNSIATICDGARTRLVEDGEDYLDAAWAFVDVGRKLIAGHRVTLAVIENTHARA